MWSHRNDEVLQDVKKWYPAEIHKRCLSLGEWADEIAFRLAIQIEVNEYRERILQEKPLGYHDPIVKRTELERFIVGLNDSKARYGVLTHGKGMAEPIVAHENVNHAYDGSRVYELGLPVSIDINLAYDDKTLINAFKTFLQDLRKGVEYEVFEKGASSAAYGKKLYTEQDTASWFEKKVLDWIDVNFWFHLNDVSISQSITAEIIGVPEHSVGNILRKREKELFCNLGLVRLRASEKVAKEQAGTL